MSKYEEQNVNPTKNSDNNPILALKGSERVYNHWYKCNLNGKRSMPNDFDVNIQPPKTYGNWTTVEHKLFLECKKNVNNRFEIIREELEVTSTTYWYP